MAEFQESRPCVECDGIMDRRHGTLPVAPIKGPDLQRMLRVHSVEVGTYYRCLKNGVHTVIVERDAILASRGAN